MLRRDVTVTLRDGRSLEVAAFGDPQHPTLVLHHGSPGSHLLSEALAERAVARGYFLITSSRAGYGKSSRLLGRRVADVVSDTQDLLDALGRDQYLTIGWSGGGPHALACAALDPGRCRGAWSIAGVVPIDVDFDWTAGMGPENLAEFALAVEGGPAHEAHARESGRDFETATAENIVEIFGGLLSAVDVAALTSEESRAQLAASCRHGFAEGYFGFYDDDRAFFSPWGFSPAEITVPTQIWYGDEDLMMPPTHGQWLVATIPGATEVHRPLEGHISVLTGFQDDLFDSLDEVWASS